MPLRVAVAAFVLGLILFSAIAWLVVSHGSSGSAVNAQDEAAAMASLSSSALLGCPAVQGPRWAYPGPAKITSDLYESYTLNYSCAAAAAWTKKLVAEKIAAGANGNSSPLGGVPGFTCFGYPGRDGRAYAGACGKGTSMGFGWNWNLFPWNVIGTTADVIVRSLGKGRYQLEIQNNTGSGTLNAFTWSPPPGLKITRVGRTVGGGCRLASRKFVCTGALQPPRCLCQSGESLTVNFRASGNLPTRTRGFVVTHGFVGQRFRITAMTPLPYLIPSVLGENAASPVDLPACTNGRHSTKKHPCA